MLLSGLRNTPGLTLPVMILLALGTSVAFAQDGTGTASNGYAAKVFATGFPADSSVGPVGLAFDSAGNLFVMDRSNGYLYKFGPTGGLASPSTQVNTSPIDGRPTGLAFTNDWHLYLARQASGDVVEINPSTGTVARIIAQNICGATGIATDPISGDLFVSEPNCPSADIVRIAGFASGSGKVSTYASPGITDGLTFAPDGTLYAALSSKGAIKISGTNSAKPGAVTYIADVSTLDGISIAADSKFLLVNRNDGKITQVGVTTDPPTLMDIFTGGSRGDFIAVGPDGCLYATQTTSILKVTNADGSCSLAPTGPTKFAPNSLLPAGSPTHYLYVLCCFLVTLLGGAAIFTILVLMRRRTKTQGDHITA